MEIEKIIELVTKEVIKRIDKSIKIKKNKKVLILSKEVKLEISNPQIDFIEELNERSLDEIDVLIINSCSNKILNNISNGLDVDRETSLIMEMLLRGKEVIILEENIYFKRFQETCNSELFMVFEAKLEKLKTFGIKVVKTSKLESVVLREETIDILKTDAKEKTLNERSKEDIDQKSKQSLEQVNGCIDFSKKKIISAKDLMSIEQYRLNEILISKNSVLTPLAKDILREHRIKIQTI